MQCVAPFAALRTVALAIIKGEATIITIAATTMPGHMMVGTCREPFLLVVLTMFVLTIWEVTRVEGWLVEVGSKPQCVLCG